MDNTTAPSTSAATPEARPKLTPNTPKPVPTTFAGKLRAKLPSRGWMIFWGTVGTLGGLVVRDHYLTVDAKKRVADKVDVLSKQSCGVQEMPRKVTVYIMPPPGDGIHKTRHYFKQFVKPVFDAAAMDYEVREASNEGQIREMVAADVRRKRQVAAGKEPALTEQEQNAPLVPMKSVSDGIVVLGRIALGEVLKGYNDGCLQSLDDPEPVVQVESAKEVSLEGEAASLVKEATGSVETTGDNDAKKEESSTAQTTETTPATPEASATPAVAEPVVIPQDEAYFSLPPTGLEPIGYIPFKNLVGFRNFHKKLYALFNSYDCVEYAGGSVMKVAFAETKDMEKDDLEIGRDEEPLFQKYRGPVEIDILDRVRENVKLYVTPQHIPEQKKADGEEENSS
ncbi:mitochondrial import inner membrane translocase subunit tim54 [Entomortierella chlamydospora]|uniref:Mitochondrial import inner membrane translocase subunit TIM54 n=1 Tax=Entomortierella chlamydospora TaxID=101097 RepID=A0A9P6N504_9FUNG|nr:mitochondrial import inner membrane translocase subunit tim54 [Entomortierella chlamydospora]KAG0023723.1 mitochondrial import inner membrane translocase subunit tim54 [Entomortierella chlamydospora]